MLTSLPDVTFYDNYTVKLSNRTLELTYFDLNHGDSLVVIRLPKEKILFVVDIVRIAFKDTPVKVSLSKGQEYHFCTCVYLKVSHFVMDKAKTLASEHLE